MALSDFIMAEYWVVHSPVNTVWRYLGDAVGLPSLIWQAKD